jgi:uncharacterized phage-associated protein
VSSKKSKTKWDEHYLLYFFYENVYFFKKFILGKKLTISHLVLRFNDYGASSGGKISSHFLMDFLGYMNVQYLFKGGGKLGDDIGLFNNEPIIERAFNSTKNKKTEIIELATINWYSGKDVDKNDYPESKMTLNKVITKV